MKYPATGISHYFRRGGLASDLILWLNAEEGKTLVGSKVSQWDDQTSNANNAVQGTDANRPTDNTTYLTFDGGDFMTIADNSGLDFLQRLSLYSKFSTVSAVNFMGLIDKYDGGDGSGYALFLNASKIPSVTAGFTKTSVTLAADTVVNDGITHEVFGSIECSRKFTNKQFICNGEEPSILKEGGVYYMFYDRYDAGTPNIYVRSSTSPTLEDSTETLLISNRRYCTILKDGSTYRLTVCDANAENIILYTSSTVDSGYSSQGILLTFGGVVDSQAVADPCEIKIGSTYYLYYSAFTAPSVATIAYATSATGAAGSYTKQGTCLSVGADGEFDDTLTADPEVMLMPDGVTYIMFYTGYKASITKQQQGYATSSDGITWTKFANNPIHYFTDPSFEAGLYGPNEPAIYMEDGICRMWYRADNTSDVNFKIGYAQFSMPTTSTINAGSETIVSKIYVDGVLEETDTQIGPLGIDYIKTNNNVVSIGGDGASTLYFVGDIYESKIWNTAQTP